jgi:hypothetical protein
MRALSLAGAVVALGIASSWTDAQAQWFPLPTGPGSIYFGVEGGYTNLEDQTGRIVPTGISVKERFDDGYNVGARAGYEWGPWRLEEEFRFQQNGISQLTLGPFSVWRAGTGPTAAAAACSAAGHRPSLSGIL